MPKRRKLCTEMIDPESREGVFMGLMYLTNCITAMTNLVRKSGLTRAARLADRLDLETDELSQQICQMLLIQKDAGELKLLGKHDLCMIFDVKASTLEQIIGCDDFPKGYFFRNKRRWFFKDIVGYIKGKKYTPEIRAKLARQFGHEVGIRDGDQPGS